MPLDDDLTFLSAVPYFRVLAGRLRRLTALVGDLSFHHIAQRVARLLVEESTRASGSVTLSQQEMATRVGTAREVVSRVLRDLEQRGMIERRPPHTIVVDTAGLRALLDGALNQRP